MYIIEIMRLAIEGNNYNCGVLGLLIMLSTEYREKNLLLYLLYIIRRVPRFLLINFRVLGCRVSSYHLTKIGLWSFLLKVFFVNVRFCIKNIKVKFFFKKKLIVGF